MRLRSRFRVFVPLCVMGVMLLSGLGSLKAQAAPQWVWMGGRTFNADLDGTLTQWMPGALYAATATTSRDGENIWFFGGLGEDAARETGYLNGLWTLDTANLVWSWQDGCSAANAPESLNSTTGVPNSLGARRFASSALSRSGEIVLFGGYGCDASGKIGLLNDLWLHTSSTLTNQNYWTKLRGGAGANQYGVYGAQFVPAPANTPGGREGAAFWIDAQGRGWVFGGEGYGASGAPGHLNDLWCMSNTDSNNPSSHQWTWIKGSDTVNRIGYYGARGWAADWNCPGGRAYATTWVDGSGRLWLFGGYGYDGRGALGQMNDLWCYDPSTGNWTWISGSDQADQPGIYGAPGAVSAAFTPGARNSPAAWIDKSGCFWLMGGDGRDREGAWGYLADVWKFDPANNNWTWVKGSDQVNPRPVYGAPGVASAANTPGGRAFAAAGADAQGRFLMLAGWGYGSSSASGPLNEIWRFDPQASTWTFLKATTTMAPNGVYGRQGVASPANIPGARYRSCTWTDKSGGLWLFGGYGYGTQGKDPGYLDDLWRFDPKKGVWTWVCGNKCCSYNLNSTIHVMSPPGFRSSAAIWVDKSGCFWLFGGLTCTYGNSYGKSNDLWRFDPVACQWTRIKGTFGGYPHGVYGTRGVPAPANTPGGRFWSSSWTDASGRLWLFGGEFDSNNALNANTLNDLWCFDPVTGNWTWMDGANTERYAPGVYGTQGFADPANTPGGRSKSLAWTDATGKLWLFGGYGLDDWDSFKFNDLWCFDPAAGNWTWVKGSKYINAGAVYGTLGVPNSNNTPGATDYYASAWTDLSGRFWFNNGELWSFDPRTKNWTWQKAKPSNMQTLVYGQRGRASAANAPGWRDCAATWTDRQGRMWLFGGNNSYLNRQTYGIFMDLWYFSDKNAADPAAWRRLE